MYANGFMCINTLIIVNKMAAVRQNDGYCMSL